MQQEIFVDERSMQEKAQVATRVDALLQ